jgi:NHLM bacteriocin system ABC transporter ATP-binding protein
MSETATSSRISLPTADQGFTLGASGNRLVKIERGEMDFFAIFGNRQSDQPRDHLFPLSEGTIVFDIGFQHLPADLVITGSPQIGTAWNVLPDPGNWDEWVAPLEQWIRSFLEAVLRFSEGGRDATRQAQAGALPALGKSQVLGVRQGILWWENRGGEVEYLGIHPAPDEVLPLISRACIQAREEVPPSRLLTTREFLASGDGMKKLARVHATLSRALQAACVRREELKRARGEERSHLTANLERSAWGEIADVLRRGRPGGPTAQTAVSLTSVEEAFRQVASYLDATVEALPSVKGRTLGEALADLVRSASLRWRQVLLDERWNTRNHGPLIGAMAQTGEAVALLPAGARRYDIVWPDGRRERVTAKLATSLSPVAYSLYRTLPNRKLKLRDVFQFAIRGSLPDFGTILAMVVVTGILSLATPALSAHIYDVIIPQSERNLMLQITIVLLCAGLANVAFELVRSVSLLRIENRTDSQLEAAIWDRLLKLPTQFFRKYTAGDLATRAQGISDAHQVLAGTGAAVLFTLPVGLFNLIVMFYYDSSLALWGLGIALTGALIAVAFSLGEIFFLRDQYAIRGKLAGLVFQLINGVGKIRMANAESFAFATWAHQYAEQEKLAMKIGRVGVGAQTFYASYSLLATAIIFGMVGWQMEKMDPAAGGHGLSTGQFLAFNAAFGALIGSLVSIAQSSLSLLQLFPLLERTKPIFDTEPEVAMHRAHPGELQGGLEIANLHFAYRPDLPPVLNGVSLKIEPGKMVAIVGPSGCGKSTLLRLLLGFESPDSGSIFYDGKDLQTLDLLEVRRQIGVVLQNTRLITGDIFRNIVGESNLTMEDAWQAARMAGLAEDIRALPMQMYTMISEGGGGFSGGQKQRLAIARAFAHRPRLLFFDEATSALDNRTQAIVTQSMQELQVTRLVVAHRLSTIMGADLIIMMNEGRIVEEGAYDELMARKGAFFQLAQRQIA